MMMELRGVTKHYTQGRRMVHALRGVDLKVHGGEFVSIMGPSGSGKSTLMHLLGALDTPSGGEVYFQDRALHTMKDRELALLRRQKIGFIFQFFNLMPTLTAVENVALPLLLSGQSRAKALKPAYAELELVGLKERAEHYPDQMSGGEMQRVAIARALVIQPVAVLCDEPTGNLDSANSKEILRMLRDLPRAGQRVVVMVTHDPAAAAYGDRIIRLRDGLIETEESVPARMDDDVVPVSNT
jgi:putative ABC transport system ATP-binding protein